MKWVVCTSLANSVLRTSLTQELAGSEPRRWVILTHRLSILVLKIVPGETLHLANQWLAYTTHSLERATFGSVTSVVSTHWTISYRRAGRRIVDDWPGWPIELIQHREVLYERPRHSAWR